VTLLEFDRISRPDAGGTGRCVGLVALLVLLLVAPPALAQSSGPDELTRQQARRHFKNGASAFRNEDYKAAIRAFEKAYEMNPDGMILYNLSLAHLRSGDLYQALDRAQKADGSGDLSRSVRVRNRARIRALDQVFGARTAAKAIARQRKARASSTETGQTSGPAEPDGGATGVSGGRTDTGGSTGGLGPIGWAGIGVAAAGLGSIGGAGLVDSQLQSDVERYRRAAQSGDIETYNRLESDIRRRQSLGRTLLYSGIGAAGVGLLVLGLDASGSLDGGEFGLRPMLHFGATPAAGLDARLRW
jgi:tetratricopeptide (TPR) repeat protein